MEIRYRRIFLTVKTLNQWNRLIHEMRRVHLHWRFSHGGEMVVCPKYFRRSHIKKENELDGF